MAKNLVIIGAGGFGREMFAAARESLGYGEKFTVKGFLDGNPDALRGYCGYPDIIGAPETYGVAEDDVFITALGSIAARRRCAAMIEERGGRFVSVVHRTASLGPNVTVIGHDSALADYTHVYSLVSIGGGVRVEEGASVYPGARIVPRVTVGAGAVVGIGSTVVRDVSPGITVFGVPAGRLEAF